jgi:hypothetical protein
MMSRADGDVVSRRHQKRSAIIITNHRFAGWWEMFLSAACVMT